MTSEADKKEKPDPAADRERNRLESMNRLREVVGEGDLYAIQAAIRRHVTHFPDTEQLTVPSDLYARLWVLVERQNPRARVIQLDGGGGLYIRNTAIVEGPSNGQ